MRKNDRRKEILDTASCFFERKGYRETKMADIAEACGIAKATMYEYFRSKEELAAEWSRRFRREYEERVARDVLVHDSPSEKMKAMIRLDLKQIRTFSGHFLTAFEANAVFSNEESSFLREISAILTYHNELILSIIEEGQTRGEFRKIDPKFVATMLAGAFLSLQRAASDAKDSEKCVFGQLFYFPEEWSSDLVIYYIFHGIAC